MRIIQRIVQRPTQTLVMTRQLQQAIHLLELSNLELASYLEQALLENPILEAEHLCPEESTALGAEEIEPYYDDENLWSSHHAGSLTKKFTSGEQETDPFHDLKAPEKTLREVVAEQIRSHISNQKHQLIASNLLFYLEPSGYLAPDYKEVQKTLKCTEKDLEDVVAQLQKFEPAGVFARTLAECLRPQLQAQNLLSKPVEIVLQNLQKFADGHLSSILKMYHLSQEEFAEALMLIQQQNPKPGLEYEYESNDTIIPDAYLSKSGNTWVVRLNDNSLPRILINKNYLQQFNRLELSPHEKKYINERLHTAHFIIKALEQRAQTLMQVCTEIVKRQTLFFQYGILYLKPMTLKEISQSLHLHESTISRVTTNKYIQTPRGTFELKYFFTSKLQTLNKKKDLSSETIKFRIKALIHEEKKMSPLSDEALVDLLKAEGIQVARRTITKYRESQNIPSSYERKKRYKMEELFHKNI